MFLKNDIQSKIRDIFSSEDLPENKEETKNNLLSKFIDYTQTELGLDSLPKLIYSYDRNEAPMTTGVFIPDENTIYVYVKDRAFCDWLRTLAHELVHYKQHVENRIPEQLNGRNKELEDEANTVAGDLIYNFAHSDENNKKIYEV